MIITEYPNISDRVHLVGQLTLRARHKKSSHLEFVLQLLQLLECMHGCVENQIMGCSILAPISKVDPNQNAILFCGGPVIRLLS